MNIGCFLFTLGIVSQNPCVPIPAPYQAGYIDAESDIRGEVDQAIEFANEILQSAGNKHRIVSRRWNSQPDLDENAIAVYLITQPGMISIHQKDIEQLRQQVDEFRLENFEMDDVYENCSDRDDCVENLYKGKDISALVISTLENIANSHIALADDTVNCRCIFLYENDLQRFNVVFGKPWGSFLVGARWSGEPPPKISDIPRILQEPDGVPLRRFLTSILLHEVGHHERNFRRPSLSEPLESILEKYEASLNASKLEELRADAFSAVMMRDGCFSQAVSLEAKESCVAAVYMPMIMFGIELWGKTKEARCIRYFDTSEKYPNYYFRGVIRDAIFSTSKSSLHILEEFVETRMSLSQKTWTKEIARCQDVIAATFALSSPSQ